MSGQDFYDENHPVFDSNSGQYYSSLYEIEMLEYHNNKSPSSGSIIEEPDIVVTDFDYDIISFVPTEMNMSLIDTRPTVTVGVFGRLEITYDDVLWI